MVTQQLILSLCLVRFFQVVQKILHLNQNSIVFILLCLSPLSIGWSRFVLTECLSISISILLFSELLLCNYKKKLKIYRLTLIFLLGFFLRYDFLLWSIPILFICYNSLDFYQTIKKGLICLSIFGLLVSLWSYRNLSQGLSLIPGGEFNSQYITLEENQQSYKGYLKWVETWSWHNYMYAPAVYPLSNNNYKNLLISDVAFEDSNEKAKVTKLIDQLKQINGEKYPKYIDAKFFNLAKQRARSNPIREYLILPIKRSFFMLFNPFTSLGMPNNISEENKTIFKSAKMEIKINILKENFASFFFKILNFFYRLTLYILFCYLLINLKNFSKVDKNLILSTLIYFLFRIILFSQVYFTATRHLLQPLIMLEMTIVIIYLKNYIMLKRTR